MIFTLHYFFAKLPWKTKHNTIIAPTNKTFILPLGYDSSHRNSILISLGAPIDESMFLLKAKVKRGTYAGELLANLYDEIFNRSLELKYDYADYYAIEYGTFDEYVRKRFLFTLEIVNDINVRFAQSCQIIYFQPSFHFLIEDYGVEFLENLFEPRGEL